MYILIMNISGKFLEVVRWNATQLTSDEQDRLWDNKVECTFTRGQGTLLNLPEDAVYLEHLKSITPRIGYGKASMQWFSLIADDIGAFVYLHPCAPEREKSPESQNRLIRFYQNFNFQFRGNSLMVRAPTPARRN